MEKVFVLLFILLFSCHGRTKNNVTNDNLVDSLSDVEVAIATDSIQLEEFFADSLNIGIKQHNKIEISKYRTLDSCYVAIAFYSKDKTKWILRNKFQFKKDGITGADPNVLDFNNDGMNDFTYVSAVAARGANEVRRLFIYNKRRDQLVCIKNSEDYPNMLYNKELDCIDAFLVYGGSSTVFLKIRDDSLKEFASIDLFNGLTITTYDDQGKEKVIYRDTTTKTDYKRYKSFSPLKEYVE